MNLMKEVSSWLLFTSMRVSNYLDPVSQVALVKIGRELICLVLYELLIFNLFPIYNHNSLFLGCD